MKDVSVDETPADRRSEGWRPRSDSKSETQNTAGIKQAFIYTINCICRSNGDAMASGVWVVEDCVTPTPVCRKLDMKYH